MEPKSEALRCLGRAVGPLLLASATAAATEDWIPAGSVRIQDPVTSTDKAGLSGDAAGPCMAAEAVAGGAATASLSRMLASFMATVCSHSGAHLPEEVRTAAVDALGSSGLLLLHRSYLPTLGGPLAPSTHNPHSLAHTLPHPDQHAGTGAGVGVHVGMGGGGGADAGGGVGVACVVEPCVLSAWLELLRLMEDDDAEVRGEGWEGL